MRLVVPFGFYGWGNIGDEATLQGFARLVEQQPRRWHVSVASRNPRHTAWVEPSFRYFKAVGRDWRRRWAKFRADAIVFAGGTPIMDCLGEWPLAEVVPIVEEAGQKDQPVVFVGVGTESLDHEVSKQTVAERLAPIVRHWTVRSDKDKSRLQAYGVPSERMTVAADMAWLLTPVTSAFGRGALGKLGITDELLVGVNVMNEPYVLRQSPHLFKELAKFLDDLIQTRKVRVLFFANEVRTESWCDTAASQIVTAEMKHADRTLLFPNKYWTPQQMMSLISCCTFTISMRYHFCLFSALQLVPFIALERSDKVVDLRKDLCWDHGIGLSVLTADKLAQILQALERRTTHDSHQIAVRLSDLRKRAGSNIAGLESPAIAAA